MTRSDFVALYCDVLESELCIMEARPQRKWEELPNLYCFLILQ